MGIVQTDEEQSCIQDGRRGRRNGQGGHIQGGRRGRRNGQGKRGTGQSNFELSINSDYVHEGRLTLVNIVGVNAGSQSLL